MHDVFFCGLLAHDLDGLIEFNAVINTADIHQVDSTAERLQIHRSGAVGSHHGFLRHDAIATKIGHGDFRILRKACHEHNIIRNRRMELCCDGRLDKRRCFGGTARNRIFAARRRAR